MATKRVYYARPGAHISNADAALIGVYLNQKGSSDGVTAEEFVEDAQRKTSLLHPYLEWDDSKAAHEHRLEQARSIMRSILVRYTPGPDQEPAESRAFEVVKLKDRPGAYLPIRLIAKNEELAEQVAERYLRELEALNEAYAGYEYMIELIGRVREAVA